jgi:hypothetical protein
MDWGNNRIRLSHQDGAGIDTLSGTALPVLVQSRKGKQRRFLGVDAIGLLSILTRLPLEKSACGYQATAVFESRSEGWFGFDGLCAGIDGAIADLFIFGPERNQTPVESHPFTALFTNPDGSDIL